MFSAPTFLDENIIHWQAVCVRAKRDELLNIWLHPRSRDSVERCFKRSPRCPSVRPWDARSAAWHLVIALLNEIIKEHNFKPPSSTSAPEVPRMMGKDARRHRRTNTQHTVCRYRHKEVAYTLCYSQFTHTHTHRVMKAGGYCVWDGWFDFKLV